MSKNESESTENQDTSDEFIVRLAQGMRTAEHARIWNRNIEIIAQQRGSSSDSVIRLAWGMAVGYRVPPPGMPPGKESYSLLSWGELHIISLWRKCGTEGAEIEQRRERTAALLGVSLEVFCSWVEADKAAGRKGFL